MKVRWTLAAKRDLVDLHEFYTEHPQLARPAAQAILRGVKQLQRTPGIGRPGRVPGTRELLVGDVRFIMAYAVVAGELHLLRVLHSARPWPDVLS